MNADHRLRKEAKRAEARRVAERRRAAQLDRNRRLREMKDSLEGRR